MLGNILTIWFTLSAVALFLNVTAIRHVIAGLPDGVSPVVLFLIAIEAILLSIAWPVMVFEMWQVSKQENWDK